MREDSVRNTPLAPSTEKAYHQKCVELKRRLRDIEEANDAARLRKRRIDRSILKMRLERAFLLERLAKAQNQPSLPDGAGAASDKSTSPPQTPQERAPRVRRQYPKSPPLDQASQPTPSSPSQPMASQSRSSAYPPQPAPLSSSGHAPQHGAASSHSSYPSVPHDSQLPYSGPPLDHRAPSTIPLHEKLPLIHSLPNGTNVVIIDGQPKQPPWTIRDVEPRHHLRADFEQLSPAEQMDQVTTHGYTPYDNHGNPVVLHQYENSERIRHVFRDDPEWRDPVVDNVRMDDPWRSKRQVRGDEGGEGRRSASGGGSVVGDSRSIRYRAQNAVNPAGPTEAGGGFTAINHH